MVIPRTAFFEMNVPIVTASHPRSYGPLWRYCLFAFPVALLPSIVLLWLARTALTAIGIDTELIAEPDQGFSWRGAFAAVAIGPFIETLFLAALLGILNRLSSNLVFVAMASALAWGCLHAAFGPMWFFGTVWSFFVFSVANLQWRQESFLKGLVAAGIPHSLVNATAMTVQWFEQNVA